LWFLDAGTAGTSAFWMMPTWESDSTSIPVDQRFPVIWECNRENQRKSPLNGNIMVTFIM
jgi:multidrug resistance efflux pump